VYILDTDTLSNLTKRRPSPRLLRHLEFLRQPIYTTAITVAELTRGLSKFGMAAVLLERANALLRDLEGILPFDEPSARICGRIAAMLEQRGLPLDFADLQIAAIALHSQCTLVTHNRRHFERVPGLAIDDWL
jgi:tRNA(fMet)-specific endonuclease VapC